MKCPKCGFVGFSGLAQCKNCGHLFESSTHGAAPARTSPAFPVPTVKGGTARRAPPTFQPQEKSPTVAFLLSLPLPGVGHFYCGKKKQAIWIMILFGLSLALSLGPLFAVSIQFLPIVAFPLLLYAFAFVDAYFTAREISLGIAEHIEKNPRLAAFLNLAIAGSGYWYVGRVSRGIVVFLLFNIGGSSAARQVGSEGLRTSIAFIALIALAAFAFDAYRIARRKNQEALVRRAHRTHPHAERPRAYSAALPIGLASLVGFCLVGLIIARVKGEFRIGDFFEISLGRRSWEDLNASCETSLREARYPEAFIDCVDALTEAEKFGPQDPRLATGLNNLAALYAAQGKYARAERLFKRSLAIKEKALGKEHPSVATSLNNLAALYAAQGKYAQAEPLYQRALAIREKTLGPERPDVAQSLNNMAWLYFNQGKYVEAEPLYQRALPIAENALGSDHPNVATILEGYTVLLRKMDRGGEAEDLEARAQAIRAKHGKQNPQKWRELETN